MTPSASVYPIPIAHHVRGASARFNTPPVARLRLGTACHPHPAQSVSLGYPKPLNYTRGGFPRASSHRNTSHQKGTAPTMFVTRHNAAVERGLLERLWSLYELAYRHTAEESASREMLFRSEFDAAISDSTNRLWVLWSDDEPVAMVLIATDIGSARDLRRPFFARQFAEHSRRGAVHYILFVVVHPRFAAKGVLTRLARDVLGTEAAEGVLLVFDAPEVNQPREEGGVALLMERLATMVTAGAPVLALDVSRYYGVDFAACSAYIERAQQEASDGERSAAEPAQR